MRVTAVKTAKSTGTMKGFTVTVSNGKLTKNYQLFVSSTEGLDQQVKLMCVDNFKKLYGEGAVSVDVVEV